jgi:PAS domain S-box-containing protein
MIHSTYFINKKSGISEFTDSNTAQKDTSAHTFTGEAPILLFSLDNEGTILLLEGRILEILGMNKRDLLGTSIYDVYSGKPPILENIRSAISKNQASSRFEINDRVFQIYFTITRNLNGDVIGVLGVAIDTTERKRAEKTIKRKNEQISLLYETGKLLSRSLDLDNLYDIVFNTIIKVAECDTLFISRYYPEEKIIRYTYLRDRLLDRTIDTASIPAIPLAPKGYGILSEVIRSGESAIINDYQARFKKVKTYVSVDQGGKVAGKNDPSGNVKSALIVPIKLEKKVIGAIQIYSGRENAYTNDQLTFIEGLMQPLAFATNNAALYQNAQKEIRERTQAEIRTNESLMEKELLLKEVNHRVKNNLQIINSLMNIQARHLNDEKLLLLFKESQNRIKSISLIHELLYTSNNLLKVNFSKYVKDLTTYLLHSFGIEHDRIILHVDTVESLMSIENLIPCGLIINELVSNSLEHAFPEQMKGEIYVILKYIDDTNHYELTVKDNGIGLPNNFDIHVSSTLGLKIVTNLVKQLNGKMEVKNGKGTEYKIVFPPADYNRRL